MIATIFINLSYLILISNKFSTRKWLLELLPQLELTTQKFASDLMDYNRIRPVLKSFLFHNRLNLMVVKKTF